MKMLVGSKVISRMKIRMETILIHNHQQKTGPTVIIRTVIILIVHMVIILIIQFRIVEILSLLKVKQTTAIQNMAIRMGIILIRNLQ